MIWIEDIQVLFDIDKLKNYFPGSNLHWHEQANALVRFVIYLSLITYVYNSNVMALLFPPLIMMVIQYYLYKNNQLQSVLLNLFGSTDIQNVNQLPNTLDQYHEDEQVMNGYESQNKEEFSNDMKHDPLNLEHSLRIKHPLSIKNDNENSTGIPTSSIGPRADMGTLRNEPNFEPREIECKRSTEDNPFGNALPYDTIEKQVNPVCPNEFSKDQNFYSGLFNSVSDLFDRNNSQRQFSTNPASTRINDREAAIQFFYNTPYTEH